MVKQIENNKSLIIKEGDKHKVFIITILLCIMLLVLPLSPFMVRHNPLFLFYIYCVHLFCIIASLLMLLFLKSSKKVLLQIDGEGVSMAITNGNLHLGWEEVESVSVRQVAVVDNKITSISWDTIKTAKNCKSIRKAAGKMQNVIFVKPEGQDELGLSLTPYITFFSPFASKLRNIVSEYKNDPNCFSCTVLPYWKEVLMYWSLLLKRK